MSAMALAASPLFMQVAQHRAGGRRTMAVVLEDPPGMDEQAFRSVYARTARPLRAYLGRVLGNAALADDLLQETYYRFLRSRFSSDDEAYQKSYLFRIATNLARDHFRRPKIELGEEAASDAERCADASFGDEITLRTDVSEVLAELRPRDRAMLWLAYVEGATHQEIGEALGLKATSIRSMLFRARQRMVELVTGRGLAPASSTGGEL
jgi:RNA polymerase sigma-70 factor (ECF subfamily)